MNYTIEFIFHIQIWCKNLSMYGHVANDFTNSRKMVVAK